MTDLVGWLSGCPAYAGFHYISIAVFKKRQYCVANAVSGVPRNEMKREKLFSR